MSDRKADQWQKSHPIRTAGKWENTDEHDAKWWALNSRGWEIRALYAIPTLCKLPIPPGGAEMTDVCYVEGWNQCCDTFFGGLPAQEPVVITIETRPEIIESGEPSESAGMPVPEVIPYPPPQAVWLFPVPKDDATPGVFE